MTQKVPSASEVIRHRPTCAMQIWLLLLLVAVWLRLPHNLYFEKVVKIGENLRKLSQN